MRRRVVSCSASAVLWGSGQFFVAKQRIKGIVLFLIEIAVLCTEFFSGYYPEYLMGTFDDFSVRVHGGLFARGIWGLVTLGKYPGIGNDHSTVLLVRGIIVSFVLMIILGIYIYNIVDAYRNDGQEDSTKALGMAKKNKFAYIAVSPAVLMVIFIVLLPIVFTVLIAFTNYDRQHMPPGNLVDWVGLDNFKRLFSMSGWGTTFFGVLSWTIVWALTATLSTYLFGMLQAVLLNSKYVKCKSLFRSIMILPWAIPQMITLLVFKNMLNSQFGPIAKFLVDIGLTKERIPFLTDPTVAKVTVILVNLWLGFPMFMIMIQGVLAGIDTQMYEAASIDGAGGFKKFTRITFPIVFKATSPLVVMSFAANFNGFGAVFFLTEGGPVNADYQFAGSTDILISWIYNLTLNQQMYGMASVMCILLFVIIGAFSIWNFRRTSAFKDIDNREVEA